MSKAKVRSSISIKSEKSQVIMLFALLIIAMTISLVATLMATGAIQWSVSSGKPINEINDAESICTQYVTAEFGDTIQVLTVDDFSSRFDEASGTFKMFYELDLFRNANHQTGTDGFYINCFVSASGGSISRIEYLEQDDSSGKPVKRNNSNFFGF